MESSQEQQPYELSYVRLLVDDVEECHAFYRDILGFESGFHSEGTYVDLQSGEVAIALFRPDYMATALGEQPLGRAGKPDTFALVFAVHSVDQHAERLLDVGVPLVSAPQDRSEWGIRTVHFRDPAGNLIELFTQL